MKRLQKTILLPVAAALMLSACGRNPFGAGAPGGLDLFAKFAKAMGKPSAIHEEENNKEGNKQMVSQGTAKRYLGKGLAQNADGVDSSGLTLNGSVYTYWEAMTNKPSDDEPGKLMSGRAEVEFKYNGVISPLLITSIDTTKITDIVSFHFKGTETKIWNHQESSLEIQVTFSVTTLSDVKPGMTTMSGKVTKKSDYEDNLDDSAYFSVDTLVGYTQYGSGFFYDARTGKDGEEGPKTFSFGVQILHNGTFANYSDNEGVVTFMLPWGGTSDSLHFTIHFYPGEERKGEIHKNTADGRRLVYFEGNDKTGRSLVIIYDENGKEISREERASYNS